MQHQFDLDPLEFFEDGYAQEVNCSLLHPVGLSLFLHGSRNGLSIRVADYRHLPSGILYSEKVIWSSNFKENSDQFQAEYGVRALKRYARYGFVVQTAGVPTIEEKEDGSGVE